MCVQLRHGSQPRWRSDPELMLSRCRVFGGSSFPVCASVPLEHSVLFFMKLSLYTASCFLQWHASTLTDDFFYLYSQQPQSSEKNSTRRKLSKLFRRRRKTLPEWMDYTVSLMMFGHFGFSSEEEKTFLKCCRRSTITAFTLTSYSAHVMWQMCHVYLLSTVHLQSFIYTDKMLFSTISLCSEINV